MKPQVDLSLYLVTDSSMCTKMGFVDMVSAAVKGGVTLVQMREKHASTREFVEKARRVKALLDERSIPLLINDRVDVALAVGAAGVHIGQSDMRYNDVRRLMGPDAIVGLTIDTDEQVQSAQDLDVDYLGIGPVFATATKADHSIPLGMDGFARRRTMSRHRCVAIGSVNAENSGELIRKGADGIAVVSAICASGNPEQAARTLVESIQKARE